MYYIRKVEESQWVGKQLHDAVSISDLRTLDNDISVWKDDGKVDLVKLALAFSLCTKNIRDLWCVKIPDNVLNNFSFHHAPSSTPFLKCRELHTNIVIPTLYEMGDLAEIIHHQIEDSKQVYISEQELKECFYNAVKADEIGIDFNDWKNQNFRNALAEMEDIFGQIDFSQLHNAKESKKKRKK